MADRAFVSLILLLCVGMAGCSGDRSSQRKGAPAQHEDVLVAPSFDDVSSFQPADVALIDDWLQEQVDLAQYPSLSVAIVSAGSVVYQRAIGFENLEAATKANSGTSYHVASVTKVFTTAIAARLHVDGVIDLDKPVAAYLPKGVALSKSPSIGAKITLRQLASHTSGLPRGVPGPVQRTEGRYRLEPELLYEHLSSVDLVTDPGSEELYSNLGMGLLGHALELAAGKPFDKLLKENVCDGLELDSTTVELDDQLRVAVGYSSSTPRTPQTHSYRERLAPSGGLIASAPDLAKFLLAQMKPGLLPEEMLGEVHAPVQLLDGSKARTALGWSVRDFEPIGRVLKKNGGRNNCSAWIGFAPKQEVGVVVIANCGDPNVDWIGYWLLERSIADVDRALLHREPISVHEYAKVAPFTGVRWEGDLPVVRVNGDWRKVVSIDGVEIDRIMEFAHERFGDRAHKRFAEDLVELLSSMGHEPDWSVTMGLQAESGEVENVKAEMTEANRNRVRN